MRMAVSLGWMAKELRPAPRRKHERLARATVASCEDASSLLPHDTCQKPCARVQGPQTKFRGSKRKQASRQASAAERSAVAVQTERRAIHDAARRDWQGEAAQSSSCWALRWAGGLDRLCIRSNISGLYWSSLFARCDSWLSMLSTNHCAMIQPEWNTTDSRRRQS
jgi:hypothetical protein